MSATLASFLVLLVSLSNFRGVFDSLVAVSLGFGVVSLLAFIPWKASFMCASALSLYLL